MSLSDNFNTAAANLMEAMDDGGWQYLPAVGDPVDVYGYLDESSDVRLDAFGRPLTINGKVLHLLRSEYDEDPGAGDEFTRSGTSYSFQSILRKDGHFYEIIVREETL